MIDLDDQQRETDVGDIFTLLCKVLKKELEAKNVTAPVIKEARQFCKEFSMFLTSVKRAGRDATEVEDRVAVGPHPFPKSDTA